MASDVDARPPGLLRGLATRLTTPLLPDDYLHLLNPLWSARELRGVVVDVVTETETAATLVIKPGWGWSGEYRAGQYVGIGIQLQGRWHWRSYSLTSVPTRKDGGTLPDVVLLHSAPAEHDVLFRQELHSLVDEHPSLRLHEQLTDTMGMLDLERLDDLCPDWTERQTWVCGPPPMLDAAERRWSSAQLPDNLHVERFSIQLDGAGGEGGTVTFGAGGRTAKVDGATTLLEAGEQVGVQLPFGCRMGICQSCVVPLVAGSVRDLRSGTEHVEGDRIQTCISAAAGDCVLGV